ncbi:MAG: PKD domain-containing protein [Candidatus Kariarchaeaceae archaeon]|jgi:PKD repeat protein
MKIFSKFMVLGLILALTFTVNAEPVAKIVGPEEVEPGNLVILRTEGTVGSGHQWLIIPESAKGSFFPAVDSSGNHVVLFANSRPGVYTFVLGVAEGDVSALAKHTLKQGKIIPDPDPNPSPKPVASFIWSPELPSKDSVIQFTDKSTVDDPDSIILWKWDLNNDGNIDSVDQNPFFSYEKAGIYNAELKVTDNNGDVGTVVNEIIISDVDPGPTDFRVLIIEETEQRPNLPSYQAQIFFDPEVRKYLDDKAGVGNWKIVDDDLSEAELSQAKWDDNWRAAYKQALKLSNGKRPFVLVTNGVEGAAVPLPKSVTEMMVLLKKYGE